MQFIYRQGRAEHELELRLGRPDATVGDLATALGIRGTLLIDGRDSRRDSGLVEAGLVAGSTVGTVPATDERPAAVLRVVGGLESGVTVPLPPGRATVGRGPEVTVSLLAGDISRMHCAVEVTAEGQVTVTDLQSSNGTDVNGERITQPTPVGPDDLVCLAGQVLLRILPPGRLAAVQHVNPVREARPGGTMPFTRVPRTVPSTASAPVRMPKPPSAGHRTPFSVAMMLGPIVLAGVMVMIMKEWTYALFALLTPLIFLGEFIEQRTRGRFSLRKERRTYAKRLAEAKAELASRHAEEVRHRRASCPDPAELLNRAQAPGLRLWERRPAAADFLQLGAGLADQSWLPPMHSEAQEPDPEELKLAGEFATLPAVPAVVSVAAGDVVGIEGDRAAALSLARSLLAQAVATSGPADVAVTIFADPDRIADWDWAKWLPHGMDLRSGSTRLVAVGGDEASSLARALIAQTPPRNDGPPARVTLVVVDGATLLEGRPCPLRELLATPACGGIVLTERLPALCTSVVTVTAAGGGELRKVATGEIVRNIVLCGMPDYQARLLARALARFEDPELRVDGAGLPDSINLLPLLELPAVTGDAVATRWRDSVDELRVRAVLGVTERELFRIDLDDDGPHGLIAGTTGSGKSELLRTLIASMAIGTDPEHLTFALVDYKGGGALDECARLPHTVGLVTDLDEQLGERALRCMEAELKHREHALREVGLGHVREYQRLRDKERPELEPMPRLVVVIDEFATLVKALPEFVDSLVSIAQRGRSLGMHLIMATQRPAGSVSDAIKNNVKLRIALRLESSGDSSDVIDSPVAAGIGSRQWGRAYYRLSMREMLPVQTALSTGVTPEAAAAAPVTVVPFLVTARPSGTGLPGPEEARTDLQRLVGAAQQACTVAGIAEPRRPWPEPLGAVVPLTELAPTGRGMQSGAVVPAFALADDPDRQTQYAVGWDPDAGNLLVYGAVGSGTTTALAALACSLAMASPPDRQHLFVLDLGAGGLAPLGALPHTGAYIAAAERERQVRLIRMLRNELDARKAGRRQVPWLTLIDNIGALLADFEKDAGGMALIDELARAFADGPAVGLHFAATADRSGAVPGAWSALTQQKLLMRLADPNEYANFDITRKSIPTYVPGRAIVAATSQIVQLGHPGEDLAATVAGIHPGRARIAPAVALLPHQISWPALGVKAEVAAEPWSLPLGVSDRSLAATGFALYEHEHAVITGPSRSGRSSALCAIALAVADSAGAPAVFAFAPRRSPLRELGPAVRVFTAYEELTTALAAHEGRCLLLVDDAETVDDGPGALDRWVAGAGTGRHVIAAGRADGIRRSYGGWLQRVRDCRVGVLLVPDYDLDGDLLGVTLPRNDRLAPLPGRGYLVMNGSIDGVQLAEPVNTAEVAERPIGTAVV
jgi:S-DNA-T family DNA segregation ATPase FtsK/SpoIIIE